MDGTAIHAEVTHGVDTDATMPHQPRRDGVDVLVSRQGGRRFAFNPKAVGSDYRKQPGTGAEHMRVGGNVFGWADIAAQAGRRAQSNLDCTDNFFEFWLNRIRQLIPNVGHRTQPY